MDSQDPHRKAEAPEAASEQPAETTVRLGRYNPLDRTVTTDLMLEFADSLEQLSRGQLSPDEIRERYWADSTPQLIQDVMACVEHYLSDDDVRAKDAAYRQMQETEMARLVQLLRTGGTRQELLAITFL